MASVRQSWIRKYGEEVGLEKWNNHKKTLANTLDNYIIRYGEIIGNQKWIEYKNKLKYRFTLNWYIEKFGLTTGTLKYTEKNKKLSVGVASLKRNGFTDDEIVAIRKRHADGSVNTIESFKKRYGNKKGNQKYLEYIENLKLTSKRTLDYWLMHHMGDFEASKVSLRDYQKRDKQWFIATFGEIDGIEQYHLINKSKGRTIENYIKKYGNDIGIEKYNKSCKNWKSGQRGIFNSKGQLEVESFLRTMYSNVIGHRSETGIILDINEKTKLNQNILYPDIIVNNKYIIRYNGDFWHARETIFPSDTEIVPRIKKTAGEIRQIDEIKNKIYKNRNFTVISIWDTDWHSNKEQIKNKLREQII